jgi:hypothetical protein
MTRPPQSNPSPEWVADLHAIFEAYHGELLRVCPELAEADGVGGPNDLLPSEVLAVLRALPDGAGIPALDRALETYRAAPRSDRDRDV